MVREYGPSKLVLRSVPHGASGLTNTLEDEMVSKRLLNISEVATRLNVPLSRCYEMARSGLLPTVRLGRQIRVDPDGLQAWIDGGGRTLPGGWRRDPEASNV